MFNFTFCRFHRLVTFFLSNHNRYYVNFENDVQELFTSVAISSNFWSISCQSSFHVCQWSTMRNWMMSFFFGWNHVWLRSLFFGPMMMSFTDMVWSHDPKYMTWNLYSSISILLTPCWWRVNVNTHSWIILFFLFWWSCVYETRWRACEMMISMMFSDEIRDTSWNEKNLETGCLILYVSYVHFFVGLSSWTHWNNFNLFLIDCSD